MNTCVHTELCYNKHFGYARGKLICIMCLVIHCRVKCHKLLSTFTLDDLGLSDS